MEEAIANTIDRFDVALVSNDDLLGDFARPFKDLIGSGKALSTSFRAAADAMGRLPMNGVIQFTLRSGRKQEHWGLALTPRGSEAIKEPTEEPGAEILTDSETWTALARGQLSLLEAFVGGRLRVRGNINLVRAMARSLQ